MLGNEHKAERGRHEQHERLEAVPHVRTQTSSLDEGIVSHLDDVTALLAALHAVDDPLITSWSRTLTAPAPMPK